MTKGKSIVIAAAAMTAVPAAATNLVTNGGFESPGGIQRTNLTTANYIPGWTYSNNGTGLDIYEDDSQDGLTAADGHHYVSFGHNGTYGGSLTQTVQTLAGHAYNLSLYTAEQQGDDPTQQFLVNLTTALGGTYSFSIGGLTGTFTKTVQEFFPDSPTTITITDATPAGSGAGSNLALDRISVVDVAGGMTPGVPEPAMWAMMVAGFGIVGAMTRRRRATVVAA